MSALRVLRLCSVYEPPDAVLGGRGVRFDPIGGMQNHTAQLTRALARRGLRQHVITTRPPGAPRRHETPDITVARYGLPIPWARQCYCAPASWAALRVAPEADLVHAHLGEDLAILPMAVAASRTGNAPLVVTVQTSLAHTFVADGARSRMLKLLGGQVERWGCRRAAAVIALTPRLAGLLGESGIAADRLHVIPSGVTSAAYAGGAPDPFPGIARPRVLFVGRLARQKGVRLLPRIAQALGHNAQLVIVGDGPERRGIEADLRASAARGRVHLVGFISHDEVPAALEHADAFVMPSIYEELGSVLLEAMAAGLPIVAAHTGGIPDAVDDAALLVAPGDCDGFADALNRVIGLPRLAATLGVRARGRAGAFEWETLADAVLDVYAGAVGGVTPPRQMPRRGRRPRDPQSRDVSARGRHGISAAPLQRQ